jgi:hypothetical protein
LAWHACLCRCWEVAALAWTQVVGWFGSAVDATRLKHWNNVTASYSSHAFCIICCLQGVSSSASATRILLVLHKLYCLHHQKGDWELTSIQTLQSHCAASFQHGNSASASR